MPRKPEPILSLADATVEIATALNKGVPVAPFGLGGWPDDDRDVWLKAERLVLKALRSGAITASGYDFFGRNTTKPGAVRVEIPSDRWVSLKPDFSKSQLSGDGFDFRHIVVLKRDIEKLELGPLFTEQKSPRGRKPVHNPVRFWQIVALESGFFERFPRQSDFLRSIADALSELSLEGTGIPEETYLKERWEEISALRKEIKERKTELDD